MMRMLACIRRSLGHGALRTACALARDSVARGRINEGATVHTFTEKAESPRKPSEG
jgi:hypothetical protein